MKNNCNFIFFVVVIYNLFFLFAVILDVRLLPVSRSLQAIALVVLNILYCINNHNKVLSVNKKIRQSPFSYCYEIVLVLLLVQILISAFEDALSSTLYLSLSLLSICFLFWHCLKITYNRFESIDFILQPYCFVCIYIALASIFVFCLLILGVISLESFSIDPTKYELFKGNYDIGGYSIYNPLYMIFVGGSNRGINFFGQFGPFLGLCHEPHLSTLFLTPAAFFLLQKNKKQFLIIIVLLINVLLAGSVTNIIFSVVCVVLYVLFNYRNIDKKIRNFTYVLIGVLFLYILINLNTVIDVVGLEVIELKFQKGNLSYDTSVGILEYLYSPSSILGTGILIYASNPNATDIGFMSFCLNIIFQFFFLKGLLKLMLSKNISCKIASIGLFYFYIHSFKIGQMLYQFPLLIFMLFVGHLLYNRSVSYDKNH